MIDEKNFKQALSNFTLDKYGDRLQEIHDKYIDEFPYKYGNLPNEAYVGNFMDWLIYEKLLPETNKTILDEFVDSHPELSKELKQKLLQMKNVIRSEFIILSKTGSKIKAKDRDSKITYNVELPQNAPNYQINDVLMGRICPFGEVYRFLGVIIVSRSPLILDTDVMMEQYSQMQINEAEEMVLNPKSRLTAILNKYPANWVDGICVQYSINTKGKKNIKVKEIETEMETQLPSILKFLPEKSKEALKIVLDEGGFVKYSRLKGYSDEVTYWWKEHPPKTTIGILRLNGLLAVGKMPMSGRMYKVAFIPFDIREKLEELL